MSHSTFSPIEYELKWRPLLVRMYCLKSIVRNCCFVGIILWVLHKQFPEPSSQIHSKYNTWSYLLCSKLFLCKPRGIWARSCKNVSYAICEQQRISKGADQPAHQCSLISTFVVCCLVSMICIFAISKVSRF